MALVETTLARAAVAAWRDSRVSIGAVRCGSPLPGDALLSLRVQARCGAPALVRVAVSALRLVGASGFAPADGHPA